MTQEQKAKRYDEAIEIARQIHDADRVSGIELTTCDEIFPELAESENERIRKALINGFNKLDKSAVWYNGITNGQIIAWFEQGEQKQELLTKEKALKNSPFVEQKSAEWSEDDQSNFNELSSFILETYRTEDASRLLIWFKSIKDRVQPKQEWSEEDEVKINRIVTCLENLNVADNDILLKDVDWLKFIRPQNRWKPSDEQMEALKEACDEHWEPDGLDPLYTLWEQLKKLREE